MSESHGPRFARQLGIKRLYHYERFNPEYLSTTLRERKIHCSNPANLNDPWDCRPWLDNRCLQDPDVFQQVIAWFHRQAKEPLRPDLKLQWETKLRNEPDEQAKFIDDLSWICRRRFSVWCPSGGSTA